MNSPETRENIVRRMREDADRNNYFLCPDPELLEDLFDGLAANEGQYGYASCPCRFSSGVKTYDSDIVCPCEYRDVDVAEHGACYCGLFVSQDIRDNPKKLGSVPERRPAEALKAAIEASAKPPEEEHKHVVGVDAKGMPVWRCTVCGYLAARETPPPICPICKVRADKFEKTNVVLTRA